MKKIPKERKKLKKRKGGGAKRRKKWKKKGKERIKVEKMVREIVRQIQIDSGVKIKWD